MQPRLEKLYKAEINNKNKNSVQKHFSNQYKGLNPYGRQRPRLKSSNLGILRN